MYSGKLIRLREVRKEDLEKVLHGINNPEVRSGITQGIPYPFTLKDEDKWLESHSALNDTYGFAVETLEDSRYIGSCSVNKVDWKNSIVEVGIAITDSDYLSRGYGTDAMKTLIRFIFNEMNIHKVKLGVYSFNKRAIRSYEKCGFRVEGVLRDEIYREGKYHDIITMGILRDEFDKF